jgi:hypothetical protein
MACLYGSSFLPYGRFFNRLGGNIGVLGSYIFIFFYLTFTSMRRSSSFDLINYLIFNVTSNHFYGGVNPFYKIFNKNPLRVL